MKYIYTAIFTPDKNNSKFYARIPDLPHCITTGSSLQNAIEQITDAAANWLVVAEDEGLEIAPPTPQSEIDAANGAILSLISVDTAAYR